MELATSASSTPPTFDVFLSHNSRDKPIVERIAERLKRAGLEPWLDRWALTPGGRWQDELAAGMRSSSACAYFVGPNGEGDWEREELAVALSRAAKDRPFRLFPVLLPGVAEPFDRTTLPPFLTTRTWVDLRGGLDNTRAFQALVNAIKGLSPGPAVPLVARDDVCPYRGLQTFDEAHADLFFGRDGDVQPILEQLKASRFLAVLGPSGSGKSSLVRAGVIPALRRADLAGSDGWTIEVVRPGGRPLEALAVRLHELDLREAMQRTVDQLARDERTLHLAGILALARQPGASRLVWVIDQAEELFTLGQDEAARAQFIANLVYAASIPGGPVVVIVTLRADFYTRCAAYPALAALLARHQYLVGPMDEAGLRAVVEEPARAVGLEFESGLVDTILEDVASEPGTLPLLEHALLELWGRRRGGMLTLEAYRESGGVQGAIAQRAETIYEGFDPPRQAIARRALLRLTQPGEGTEDTRRRATLREVAGRAAEERPVEEVVRDLADARLLTTSADQQTGERWVDISHEALIRGWPRLQSWLDEDRAGLRVHRRITEAAEEWVRLGREDGVLYRGARLAEAIEWQTVNEALLNDAEREFLQASAALQKRERAGRERLRRRVTIAAVAAAVVFLMLASLSALQWRAAEEQRQTARAGQLAAPAGSQQTRPDRALLLSLEANRMSNAVEVRGSLLAELTNTRLRTYLSHTNFAQGSVAFSPDGKTLASGSDDSTIVLWDVARRVPIGEPLRGHSDSVNSVAFSLDGKTLASGSDDSTIVLWDVARRVPIGEPLRGHSGAVNSVAFSLDGKTLASGSDDSTIVLWDVARRTSIGEPLGGHSGAVNSVAFSLDGKTLASGSDDSTIVLWDVARRTSIGEPLGGHSGAVNSVAFSPDGATLASGSDDRTIVLWDVAGRVPIGDPLRGHSWPVKSVAFSPDGSRLVSGSDDNTIVLWNVASRAPIPPWPLRGHDGDVMSVAFSPVGATFASGAHDGTVVLWDVAMPAPIGEPLRGHSDSVNSVAFSPDGKRLASGGDDSTIVLWDVARRVPIGEPLRGHSDSVNSVAFSLDGKTLASGSDDSTIVLWDVARRVPIGEPLRGHSGAVNSVAFSLDGKTLASGSDDSTIVLWDVARRTSIGEPLGGHSGAVNSVAFSPDGATLASGSDDSTIVLWDVARRTPIGEPLRGHSDSVNSVAFSPDGKTLASGGLENMLVLWDVASRPPTGEPIQGFDGDVMTVAFNTDGATLASGADDGTFVLWDQVSRFPIGEPIRGDSGSVLSVALGPDGATLASGTGDGTIVLWGMDPIEWEAAACRIANRNLSQDEWDQYLGDEPYHETCPGLPVPKSSGQGANP